VTVNSGLKERKDTSSLIPISSLKVTDGHNNVTGGVTDGKKYKTITEKMSGETLLYSVESKLATGKANVTDAFTVAERPITMVCLPKAKKGLRYDLVCTPVVSDTERTTIDTYATEVRKWYLADSNGGGQPHLKDSPLSTLTTAYTDVGGIGDMWDASDETLFFVENPTGATPKTGSFQSLLMIKCNSWTDATGAVVDSDVLDGWIYNTDYQNPDVSDRDQYNPGSGLTSWDRSAIRPLCSLGDDKNLSTSAGGWAPTTNYYNEAWAVCVKVGLKAGLGGGEVFKTGKSRASFECLQDGIWSCSLYGNWEGNPVH